METSFKKAFQFEAVANAYLEEKKEETKFTNALRDMLDQLSEMRSDYNKRLVKIKRNFAAEDKAGCILRDDTGNYKYTKDGESKMQDAVDEMFENGSNVEIEPEIITVFPETLHKNFIKSFTGFLITEEEGKLIIDQNLTINTHVDQTRK